MCARRDKLVIALSGVRRFNMALATVFAKARNHHERLSTVLQGDWRGKTREGPQVVKELIVAITSKLFDRAFERIAKSLEQSPETLRANIEAHLIEVVRWSERIQFYGMSKARDTDSVTIGLSLDSVPRKFWGRRNGRETLQEDTLLKDDQHYVLLGPPGSGKTTTLKRIARRLLLEESLSETDVWQYPVVIRMREILEDDSLYFAVAKKLGIKCTVRRRVVGKPPNEEEVKELYVGEDPLEIALPEFLNETQALLLLDGLDETTQEKKKALDSELSSLAYKLRRSKILLSCRSGDYFRQLEGFDVVELCPLSDEQIQQVASRWITDSEEFLRSLETMPYSDLANRPLFLTHLIFLFQKFGYLPEQPANVYRKIIHILLEQWDFERDIKRKTKYAGFTPERKVDFLSGLAYDLTFRKRATLFSREDLVQYYQMAHKTFHLPPEEAEDVAREVETHTGIIVESSLEVRPETPFFRG